MKYDKAYSDLFEEPLTIYEVRDLNFDETSDYDSDVDTFSCPDEECRVLQGDESVLTTFNAKKIKFKKAPHFKDVPSTVHRKYCPYSGNRVGMIHIDPKNSKEEGIKATDFPTEFLLERRKYVKKKKTENETDASENELADMTKNKSKSKNFEEKLSVYKTSVFEHIVEVFIEHQDNKEKLKSMALSISGISGSYNFFFKKIRFFLDREGLVYWGKVREIRDYGSSFGVIFEDRVSGMIVSAYLSKETIQQYRKRNYFTNKIRELIGSDSVNCFFLGTYPEKKTISTKGGEFEVYNVVITNLDHFLLRIVE